MGLGFFQIHVILLNKLPSFVCKATIYTFSEWMEYLRTKNVFGSLDESILREKERISEGNNGWALACLGGALSKSFCHRNFVIQIWKRFPV